MAKIVAVDADGVEHTRKSDRHYTHAVVVHMLHYTDDPGYYVDAIARYERWLAAAEDGNGDVARYTTQIEKLKVGQAEATGEKRWLCLGFCGRYDLAVKLAAERQSKAADPVAILEAVAT